MDRIDDVYIVTCSPEFSSQCIDELVSIDNKIKVIKTLEDGVFVIKSSIPSSEFQSKIINNILIFVRHINKVDYLIDITGDYDDIHLINSYINEYDKAEVSGKTVAVQIRKSNESVKYNVNELKEEIDKFILSEFCSEPVIKNGEIIISIFIYKTKLYLGISPVKFNLSSWRGGMHHYKKDDSDVSRAKYKLMEAIERFNIDMDSISKALDLGAAPGGWTSVLLKYGIKVTSVDTGEMDQELLSSKNLTFIQKNASELKLGDDSFDIITCDISWNPYNTTKMLLDFKDNLKSGGLVLFTLKLMHPNVSKTVREIKKSLTQDFKLVNAKHLFHNRREVTLLLQKY